MNFVYEFQSVLSPQSHRTKMKFILLISIVDLSSAAYYSDKPCPERPVVKNYTVADISGGWYEIQKYSSEFHHGFDCAYTFHTQTGENTFDATRCELHNGNRECVKLKAALEHGDEGIFTVYDLDDST